jgi:peptidoglycan/LPS O-acetylase OafA/YrhL
VLAVPSAFLSEALRARWLTFSVSSLASAAFVFLALFERRRWFQALLASRYLVYTGTISYGLYLLHKIPSDVAERFSRQHQLPGFLAGLAASFLMAMLSWKLLEQPVMRWKRLF